MPPKPRPAARHLPAVPPPEGKGRETRARIAAREHLARVLWSDDGSRRLPRERELVDAIEACAPGDAWWVCEASSAGPVYLLPTREWLSVLVKELRSLKARRVLDAAAGDGFLAACLRQAAPDLEIVAVDDGSWEKPAGRMSSAERRRLRGVPIAGLVPGENVMRGDAARLARKLKPDTVIVSWAPPGTLVERLIRAPVRHVLEIGTDGDTCGSPAAWRYAKEFLDGPIERRALCRLDERPSAARHARVTLYYGAAHPRHEREPAARRGPR